MDLNNLWPLFKGAGGATGALGVDDVDDIDLLLLLEPEFSESVLFAKLLPVVE